MSTADVVREKAVGLAEGSTPTEEAVRELLEYCHDKGVPVVLARQHLLRDREATASDPAMSRAAELLDLVLERLPLA
jgi:hypothetical protein